MSLLLLLLLLLLVLFFLLLLLFMMIMMIMMMMLMMKWLSTLPGPVPIPHVNSWQTARQNSRGKWLRLAK